MVKPVYGWPLCCLLDCSFHPRKLKFCEPNFTFENWKWTFMESWIFKPGPTYFSRNWINFRTPSSLICSIINCTISTQWFNWNGSNSDPGGTLLRYIYLVLCGTNGIRGDRSTLEWSHAKNTAPRIKCCLIPLWFNCTVPLLGNYHSHNGWNSVKSL